MSGLPPLELRTSTLGEALRPWLGMLAGASVLLIVAGALSLAASTSIGVVLMAMGGGGFAAFAGTALMLRRALSGPVLVVDDEGILFREPLARGERPSTELAWTAVDEVEVRATKLGKGRVDEHLIVRTADGGEHTIPVGVLPISADRLVGEMVRRAEPHTFKVRHPA